MIRRTGCLHLRDHAQKLTTSFIAAAASAGTTLRATKSSQFLNFSLARASTIALERAGPICGTLSSSATVAVLRLTLAATGWRCGAGGRGLCRRSRGRRGMSGCRRLHPLREGGSGQECQHRRGDENASSRHLGRSSVVSPACARAFSARKPAGVCIHQYPDRRRAFWHPPPSD